MAKTASTLGRGKKRCPKCKKVLAAATRSCSCGHKFQAKTQKKGLFTITAGQIKVVAEIANRLNENSDIDAATIQHENNAIDLNTALNSGMSNSEIKSLIKRRESQDHKTRPLSNVPKKEVDNILKVLKEMT